MCPVLRGASDPWELGTVEGKKREKKGEKQHGGLQSARGMRPIILIACRCCLGLTHASHIIVYCSEQNQLCRNTEGLRDSKSARGRLRAPLCSRPSEPSEAWMGCEHRAAAGLHGWDGSGVGWRERGRKERGEGVGKDGKQIKTYKRGFLRGFDMSCQSWWCVCSCLYSK